MIYTRGFRRFLFKLGVMYLIENIYNKIKNPNFNVNKNKFNSFTINTDNSTSELCILGGKFGTDKSPLNRTGQRRSYTPVYDIIFEKFKNKKIKLAEIGIAESKSVKMWRNYFKKALIYGFDFDQKFINDGKKLKLPKTFYNHINVKSATSIRKSLKKLNTKFDIIIDDSTHDENDQIRLVLNSHKFLKKGGIIVLEDIESYNDQVELKFFNSLKRLKKIFCKIYFLECQNHNNFSPFWNKDKILIMEKK
tara:strand:- start:823 stop:1572 length:750 start_codon:yes stop_codon:yes gene_type:complete